MGLKNYKTVRRYTTMQLYWFSIIIFQLLLLVSQTKLTQASDVIRVGGLFESSDPQLRIAFSRAIEKVNKDGNLMNNTQLAAKIPNIPNNDSFRAARKVCSIIKRGVGAVFGPQSIRISDQVESICEALDIPHIKTTMDFSHTDDDYAINLHPHPSTLGRAYSEVLKILGWKKICIIYENNKGLILVQDIMKDAHFDVTLKQLPSSGDYRSTFIEAREEGVRNLVLDVSWDKLFAVLKQANQVGMVTDYHDYFITSLDLHTIGLEERIHGGAKMLSLQLVDSLNPMVQQVLGDLRTQTNNDIKGIKTEVALMYDAVEVFVKAVNELSRTVSLDIPRLDCDGDHAWKHGVALKNYMTMVEIDGMTGFIKFDAVDGFRTNMSLAVVELTKKGLERIGSWDQDSGANIAQTVEEKQEAVKEALKDKTLTVSIVLSDPYIMLSENSEQMLGNDRYEGFSVDLLREMSELLGFNFTLVQTADNSYGRLDQRRNQWTGLIGDVVNLRADLAINDLTITPKREEAVDFSLPWMDTGISILYVKPKYRPVSRFIFMAPFSLDVWIYLGLTYLGVSLILFALARLSPCEKVSEPSTLEVDHSKMSNLFSWDNSLWFTIGSLLQQRTYQQPRAASTRIVAFMWWFFVLIMTCSYTASLVSILSAGIGGQEEQFQSLEELASQSKVKYGTVNGGATFNFFKNSRVATYQNIYNSMENVKSNKEGIDRVEKSEGGYAFFMESTSIDYITERRCNLRSVEGLLDSKSYGIALPRGSPYRKLINNAIITLKEVGTLHQLKRKWWYEMRGGGYCRSYWKYRPSMEWKLRPVSGVFIILLVGVALAVLVAIAEFLRDYIKRKKQDIDNAGN